MLEDRCVPSTLKVTNIYDSGVGSLRYEIAAATKGDTIVFDPSLNGSTIILKGTELQIGTNVTIQGPGANLLAIYGGGSRIFEVDGATTSVAVSGLTLEAGNGAAYNPYAYGTGIGWSAGGGGNSTTTTDTPVDGHGGAIWNGGLLDVNACTLAYNTVDGTYWGNSNFLGGAIYNAGNLTVRNSTLTYNDAGDAYDTYTGSGGGIYNAAAGTLAINNSTLTYNSAFGGAGGAVCNAGVLSATGSSFSNNYGWDGGAVFNGVTPFGTVSNPSTTITSCTFTANTAVYAGAIWNGGSMTITGTASSPTTISGDSASQAGGGIFNAKHAKLTITFSTVLDNTAPIGADLDNAGSVKIGSGSTVGVIA
jgi:hypothetical protein